MDMSREVGEREGEEGTGASVKGLAGLALEGDLLIAR